MNGKTFTPEHIRMFREAGEQILQFNAITKHSSNAEKMGGAMLCAAGLWRLFQREDGGDTAPRMRAWDFGTVDMRGDEVREWMKKREKESGRGHVRTVRDEADAIKLQTQAHGYVKGSSFVTDLVNKATEAVATQVTEGALRLFEEWRAIYDKSKTDELSAVNAARDSQRKEIESLRSRLHKTDEERGLLSYRLQNLADTTKGLVGQVEDIEEIIEATDRGEDIRTAMRDTRAALEAATVRRGSSMKIGLGSPYVPVTVDRLRSLVGLVGKVLEGVAIADVDVHLRPSCLRALQLLRLEFDNITGAAPSTDLPTNE